MSDNYVRVTAKVLAITAYAVELEAEGEAKWIPRSVLHGADDLALRGDVKTGDEHEFQIRRWKAEQAGFV
jgi:hypothetical protein